MFNLVSGIYCTIRRPELSDAKVIAKWLEDDYLNETVFDDASFEGGALKQAKRWIESNTHLYGSETLVLMAYTIADNVPFGLIWFSNIDWRSRTADIRYLVGDAKSRQSIFGPEMVFLGTHYAFNSLNLHKLYGYILSSNTESISLADFAANKEGVLKHYIPTIDESGWEDYHIYGLFNDDFQSFIEKNRKGVLRRHFSKGILG